MIPVIMTFDRKYLLPSAAAVLSLLENADPGRDFMLYFLIEYDEEFVRIGEELFSALALRYPRFSYRFVNKPECDGFESAPLSESLNSRMIYARLTLMNVFSDLDACIYLDGDLLVLQDIGKLWDEITGAPDFEDVYLAAVPDLPLRNLEGNALLQMKQNLRDEELAGYFNAGVLVMNLKKMRADNLFARFVKYSENSFLYYDQDILNICCGGLVKFIPLKWNVSPVYFEFRTWIPRNGCTGEELWNVQHGNVSILHFAGKRKPWKQNAADPFDHAWFMYSRLLPQTDYVRSFLQPFNFPALEITPDPVCLLRSAGSYFLYGFSYFSRKLLDSLIGNDFRKPVCFCDSSAEKQGMEYQGVPCMSLADAREKIGNETVAVICAQTRWVEIRDNLRRLGIPASRIMRWNAEQEALIPCVSVGLLMGVFDDFNYEQMKIIKAARGQCRFLRIAVFSDELAFESMKVRPNVPQAERAAVLCALRDVDEVVLLDKGENISYAAEWRRRPFDCVFAVKGAYEDQEWKKDPGALRRFGAEAVYLPVKQ